MSSPVQLSCLGRRLRIHDYAAQGSCRRQGAQKQPWQTVRARRAHRTSVLGRRRGLAQVLWETSAGD
jgi:hypothetical protein